MASSRRRAQRPSRWARQGGVANGRRWLRPPVGMRPAPRLGATGRQTPGGEDGVGDRKRAKDLSRRDQGYPYVPLDQARASWEPAPGGREAGRNLLRWSSRSSSWWSWSPCSSCSSCKAFAERVVVPRRATPPYRIPQGHPPPRRERGRERRHANPRAPRRSTRPTSVASGQPSRSAIASRSVGFPDTHRSPIRSTDAARSALLSIHPRVGEAMWRRARALARVRRSSR
jgi:hypothetical protein